MVVVTFALPDEARAFTARLSGRTRGRDGPWAPILGDCGGRRVAVVYTGVGSAPSCRRRLDEWMGAGAWPRPDFVVSSGFAGGLRADLRVGDLVLARNFSNPELAKAAHQLLADAALPDLRLSTQRRLAETPESKRELADATGADAVDMETGWIAATCGSAGVPMLSLRVISDAADQALPVPGGILFDEARQRPRYAALPAWLLMHPGQIGPFVRFVRGLGPARARLADALELLLTYLPAVH